MDIKKRRQLAFLYAKQVRLILRSVALPEEKFCITPFGDTSFELYFHDSDKCIEDHLVVRFDEVYCDPAKMWALYLKVQDFFDEHLGGIDFPHMGKPFPSRLNK